MAKFTEFSLLDTLQNTLSEKGFVTPTDIQERALPDLMKGRSLVGLSETGSGKTLAYVLPILHRLKELELKYDPVTEEGSPRAVVLVPSRDLGEQVTRVFKPFTHTTRLRVRSVLGGTGLDVAKANLKGCFEVLVATPGRLTQLLSRKLVSLGDVRTLVFDEADQMLDQGFLPDVGRIANACPEKIQMVLFSATVPPAVESLIQELFAGVPIVRSEGSHRLVQGVTVRNEKILNGERMPVLERVLAERCSGGTMIFVNTREQCDRLAESLKRLGVQALPYRGEMTKVERRRNLKSFRDGKTAILISTDLASRGLDVSHVGRVINFHMPKQIENYLHRVGRTARAGREGLVINFITERDESFLAKVQKLKEREVQEWPEEPEHKKASTGLVNTGRLASQGRAHPKGRPSSGTRQ